MANRISQYMAVPQVEGIHIDVSEENLVQHIERMAWQSLHDKINSLQAEVQQFKEKEAEIERRAMKLGSVLNGAMRYVAKFAREHRDNIKDIHLGVGDGQFRFVVITTSETYDWDFAEQIAELQCVLLEDYSDIPLCCRSIPAAAASDVGALMSTPLMRFGLGEKDNAGA